MDGSRPACRQTLSLCLWVLIISGPGLASGNGRGEGLLSATVLGPWVAGEPARLAVRWDGPEAVSLDAWVDFDSDGGFDPKEHAIAGASVAPGMGLVEIHVPARARPCRRAAVRLRAGGVSEVDLEALITIRELGSCGFEEGFGAGDFDDLVLAFEIFDDGGGPALYAGGKFTVAGGERVNCIARWDGTAWYPLGTGVALNVLGGSPYALVLDLEAFDDGSGPALYASGSFTNAGGIPVNNIARWDGSTWSEVGGGMSWSDGSPVSVGALIAHDLGGVPSLFAAGAFDLAGGAIARGIARWDGSSWSEVGGGLASSGTASGASLAGFDDGSGTALFLGGSFDHAGGVAASNVARWDGSAWSALDLGVSHSRVPPVVYAMAAFDGGGGDRLCIGGRFDTAGSIPADNIACWDGAAWAALGSGITMTYPGPTPLPWVRTLTVHDDGGDAALYVGGNFDTAGDAPASNIARWDGSAWSPLDGPAGDGTDAEVCALFPSSGAGGPELWVGGEFLEAGGARANFVARWSDGTWDTASALDGDGILGGQVSALEFFDDGSGPALYVGGFLLAAGGLKVNRVARWDGSAWSELEGLSDDGVSGGEVRALEVFDDGTGPMLYAAGSFWAAGGYPADNIARWTGASWWPVGVGTDDRINALVVYDDGSGPSLYVGGQFTAAGWASANGIARFDGTGWWPLGAGTSQPVTSLAVYDDGGGPDLYVGGYFDTAGGIATQGIARWDGSGWSAVGGGFSLGNVETLAVYSDGGGPCLYAGGYFSDAGGATVSNVARWDGGAWSDVGGGVNSAVYSLEAYQGLPGLYAGGDFTIAGGVPASRIARWDGSAWQPVGEAGANGVEGNSYDTRVATIQAVPGHGLFIGGRFALAAGVPSSNLAQLSCGDLFVDGFESGDTTRWSATAP